LAFVRHLLRHFDDPAELRRNPLAVSYIARARSYGLSNERSAADAIRAWLADTVDMLGAGGSPKAERRREIILRCDLKGLPAKSVMADLGLSRRMFFYERKAALDMLAFLLREHDHTGRSPSATLPDPFEAKLRSANNLFLGGNLESALERFRALLDEASTPAHRCRVIGKMAWAHFYALDIAGAEKILKRASALQSQLAQSAAADDVLALAALEMTSALMAYWYTGTARQRNAALARLIQIPAKLRRPDVLALDASKELLIEILVTLAYIHLENQPDVAAAHLRETERLSSSMSGSSPLQPVVATLNADLTARNAHIEHIERCASAVFRAAVSSGAVVFIDGMADTLGQANLSLRRYERAAQVAYFSLNCLDAASPLSVPSIILTARAEAACGNIDRGLRLFEQARAHASGSGIAHVTLAEIELLIAQSRLSEALEIIDPLVPSLEQSRRYQLLGEAFRLKATALQGAGRATEAIESIECALWVTEGRDDYKLLEVLETSAGITGSAAHAKRALELRSALCG
jgi:tetratricopeptide (TPR) repeat protein